jgi:hypothetical protein
MRTCLANLAISVAAVAAPALAFAQSTEGLTRAQVRADLVRVEQAGYRVSLGNDPHYPEDIEAAEAKIAAADARDVTTSAYGGTPESGTSAAGHTVPMHAPANSCVGPTSFCNPYFGS